METLPAITANNVLEAIAPFSPDDCHKGTFLVLRIAGVEQATVLGIVQRKWRSYKDWKDKDPDFKRIEAQIPQLHERFGGEARVMRTALLDAHIIEAGLNIFRKIVKKEKVSDSEFSFASKIAGLRLPMMVDSSKQVDPWKSLANAISQTTTQRELVLKEEDAYGNIKQVTAKEQMVPVNPAQTLLARSIIEETLRDFNGQSTDN